MWAEQGLHAAASVLVFWNTQSACLKVMFVIREANTPWCGPLHCVLSIGSDGSPETPVNDGHEATRYAERTLALGWGPEVGVLLFGLPGRSGETFVFLAFWGS